MLPLKWTVEITKTLFHGGEHIYATKKKVSAEEKMRLDREYWLGQLSPSAFAYSYKTKNQVLYD
jgi:hypothetical protein